jgi:hypothetical protein
MTPRTSPGLVAAILLSSLVVAEARPAGAVELDAVLSLNLERSAVVGKSWYPSSRCGRMLVAGARVAGQPRWSERA